MAGADSLAMDSRWQSCAGVKTATGGHRFDTPDVRGRIPRHRGPGHSRLGPHFPCHAMVWPRPARHGPRRRRVRLANSDWPAFRRHVIAIARFVLIFEDRGKRASQRMGHTRLPRHPRPSRQPFGLPQGEGLSSVQYGFRLIDSTLKGFTRPCEADKLKRHEPAFFLPGKSDRIMFAGQFKLLHHQAIFWTPNKSAYYRLVTVIKYITRSQASATPASRALVTGGTVRLITISDKAIEKG